MKLKDLVIGGLALVAIGCDAPTRLKQEPIAISGKVSKAGRPVGDVLVSFHPLDHGHPVSLPVESDGTFEGELIVGNYSYYVSKSSAPKSDAALKGVDPKYFQADTRRVIAVEEGQELLIALD